MKRIISGFSLKDWVLLALVIIAWGANVGAVKLGTNEISPYMLIVLRAVLTPLMMLPFVKKISWQDFKNIAMVGLVFFTIHYTLMYKAIDLINSSSCAVIGMLALPISILLSVLFFKEKVGNWTWAGMVVCFIGLIVAFGMPDIVQYPIGALLTILTAIAWACGSVLMKRTKHIPLMTFGFYTFAIAAPFLLASALFFEGTSIFNFDGVNMVNLGISVGYQVIVMGIMTAVWGYLISHHPTEHVAPFLMLQVPVAALVGNMFLDEALSSELLISAILMMAGIGLIHYQRLKKKA